jgi:hypothetical protein
MEGTLTFISVLFIVFGVLQIILFFKIWAMTNNVSKIEKQISGKKGYHYYMLSGEKEKAYMYLKDELTCRLIEHKKNAFNDSNFLALANMEIKDFLSNIKHTGFELPEHLKSGEAFLKYYKEFD